MIRRRSAWYALAAAALCMSMSACVGDYTPAPAMTYAYKARDARPAAPGAALTVAMGVVLIAVGLLMKRPREKPRWPREPRPRMDDS